MRVSGRLILRRVIVHGVIGFTIATAIAQFAGAFGTMGVVRGNLMGVVPRVRVIDGTTVVWSESADAFRRCIWWQRGLGPSEREGPRAGISDTGKPMTWWRWKSLGNAMLMPEEEPPWWSRVNDPREIEMVREQDRGQYDDMRYDYGVGWPWPSYKFEEDRSLKLTGIQRASVKTARSAFRLDAREFVGPNGIRAFDINFVTWNPIWFGLMGSTAFWGLLSALCFTAIGAWRQRVRRSRGACPNCGYDRRGLAAGSVCPECGHAPPVPQIAAAHSGT